MTKEEICKLSSELSIRKLKREVLHRVQVFRRSAGVTTIARAFATEDFENATPLNKKILEVAAGVLNEDNARINQAQVAST